MDELIAILIAKIINTVMMTRYRLFGYAKNWLTLRIVALGAAIATKKKFLTIYSEGNPVVHMSLLDYELTMKSLSTIQQLTETIADQPNRPHQLEIKIPSQFFKIPDITIVRLFTYNKDRLHREIEGRYYRRLYYNLDNIYGSLVWYVLSLILFVLISSRAYRMGSTPLDYLICAALMIAMMLNLFAMLLAVFQTLRKNSAPDKHICPLNYRFQIWDEEGEHSYEVFISDNK